MSFDRSSHQEIRRHTRNALKLAVPDAEIPRLRGYDHMAVWNLFQRAGGLEWWDPPVGEIKPLSVVQKLEVVDEERCIGEEVLKDAREDMSTLVPPTTSMIRYASVRIHSIDDTPIDEDSHTKRPTTEPTEIPVPSSPIPHDCSTSPSLSASTQTTAIFTTPTSTTPTTTTTQTTPNTHTKPTTPSPHPPHPFEPAQKSGPDSIRHVHYTPQDRFRGSREEFRVSFAFDDDPARSVILQERPLVVNSVVAAAKERRLSGQEAWPVVPVQMPEQTTRVLVKRKRRSVKVSASVAWRRLLGGRSEDESA